VHHHGPGDGSEHIPKHVGWNKARLTTLHDREFEKYGNQIDAALMWREKNYRKTKTI